LFPVLVVAELAHFPSPQAHVQRDNLDEKLAAIRMAMLAVAAE
jgi:hypothetical protein